MAVLPTTPFSATDLSAFLFVGARCRRIQMVKPSKHGEVAPEKMNANQEGDAGQRSSEAASTPESRFGRSSEVGTLLIFSFGGIRLRIHVAFLAMIFLLGLPAFAEGAWQHALYVPAVLMALAIHEFGHAFAARRLGQKSCTIIIHPLLSQPPAPRSLHKPKAELLTALAGPAASAVFSLAVAIALFAFGHPEKISLSPRALFTGGLATRFLAFNFYMCVINVLPAFPLDGGRAARAALALKWGDLRATRSIAAISLVWAFVFGIVGVTAGNLFVSLLGLLFIAGGIREIYEAPILVARDLELRVGEVSDRRTLVFGPGMAASEAAHAILQAKQSQYPVVHGGSLLGVIARQQILRANSSAYLSGLMTRRIVCVSENELLTAVLRRGLPRFARPVVVTTTGSRDGAFVGILCAEALQEQLMIKSARIGRSFATPDSGANGELPETRGLENGGK